jgi:hypothetical protein
MVEIAKTTIVERIRSRSGSEATTRQMTSSQGRGYDINDIYHQRAERWR